MPSRVLREGILTSELVNSLAWGEEVFYRRLHSVVDDFGRYSANLSLLRAACYPLRLDDVSDQDVGKWLAVCADKGLVRVYEVGGKRFLEVCKFEQRRRIGRSKFPPPSGTTSKMPDICQSHDGVVVEGENRESRIEVEGKALASSAARLDAGSNGKAVAYIPLNDGTDYGISPEQFAEFEKLYPAVDVKQTLNEIRGWNLANPTHRKTRSGVLRHVNRWLAKEQNGGA